MIYNIISYKLYNIVVSALLIFAERRHHPYGANGLIFAACACTGGFLRLRHSAAFLRLSVRLQPRSERFCNAFDMTVRLVYNVWCPFRYPLISEQSGGCDRALVASCCVLTAGGLFDWRYILPALPGAGRSPSAGRGSASG